MYFSTLPYLCNLAFNEDTLKIIVIARVDEGCINALLTLEYLSMLSQVLPNENSGEIVYGQAHQDPKLSKRNIKNIKNNECIAEEVYQGLPIIDERIHPMHFFFDTLNILPKCQQAELLFSMFSNSSTMENGSKGRANKILMDNFLERIKQLHNKELLLTSAESQKFTMMLLNRPRDGGPHLPFFSVKDGYLHYNEQYSYPRWKCFIKGISTTHVIVTVLPASEKDVRLFMSPSYTEDCVRSNDFENNDMSDDEGKFLEENLVIPVYVYDCSLASLIDTLTDKLKMSHNKDIYQDHTFRLGQQEGKQFIELKFNSNSKPSSPELKSEDSDNTTSDQRSLLEHCKLVSLAHCHCYVVAVYKSLVLQLPLSYEDMEAAVEQCEETLIEINITNYLRCVCRHLSKLSEKDLLDQLKHSSCKDVEPLHNLIKEKFERIMTVAFRPVPAHPEFYYCSPFWIGNKMDLFEFQKSDSDEEIGNVIFHSVNVHSELHMHRKKVQRENLTWPVRPTHSMSNMSNYDSTEYLSNDLQEDNIGEQEEPLFLQLSCSVRFQSRSGLSSVPIKSLPTCFMEILQKMEEYKDSNVTDLSPSDLNITLDIICLNLPREVLEITLERYSGLRTTSFCSGSPTGSMETDSGSSSENNTKSEFFKEKISHLSLNHHNAINNLKDEIEWLLQDETATAFLDRPFVNEDVLKFVANHVLESTDRFSCKLEKVPLYFVFPSEDSKPKFLNELKKIEIDKYRIQQEGTFFYFVKNVHHVSAAVIQQDMSSDKEEAKIKYGNTMDFIEKKISHNSSDAENDSKTHVKNEFLSNYDFKGSKVTKMSELNDECEGQYSSGICFKWLKDLDNRESFLPNFWLILKVESDYVNVYFHCRFLEIASAEVNSYWHTQKTLICQIRSTCRRVNQYLLLQNLHKTSKCSELLETETNEDYSWKSETAHEISNNVQNKDSVQNFTPGMFRCRVVWEFTFRLHPRLKTGPGRSGLSRGIKALHGVLTRFAVTNRSNMFVYQENNKNVFYLRLHEQISDGKCLQNKLSESDEKLVVSRSNSVVSLSQTKLNDNIMSTDTRPRVRSFSEKESNILSRTEDSIVLMVHGISDAGPEVKRDLVQVLQNRLDDAVLEVLSIMLARNPMCKLTPADVHFIQPPKSPESIIQLCVENHCIPYIGALEFYLRQNIQQFLYMPKYTDNRADYHFQDYSQLESSMKQVAESDIFLYNQSQSSGSKGIACIALAVTGDDGESMKPLDNKFPENSLPATIKEEDFENIVSTSIFDNRSITSSPLIEFKIWKQGRVNIEALLQKLCSAVKHAIWDLVTEYKLLSTPLTEPFLNDTQEIHTEDKNTETLIKTETSQKVGPNLLTNQFETGEEEKLRIIYCVTLSQWLRFALEIGVPSVKKHVVNINHRHAIPTIVRELEILIQSQASDTTSRAFVLKNKQPFIEKFVSNEETTKNSPDCPTVENEDNVKLPLYIPCDFSRDEQETYTNCILIARNFSQWKASFNEKVELELFAPKDQKVLQKFNPLILESSFVSRQRLLLAEIRNDNITLYMYNWSKEKSEKLMKQVTSLGTWLSSRSNFFMNILMQKLGIFHHRPSLAREDTNSHYLQSMDMESLTKFSFVPHNDEKERARSNNRTQNIKHNQFSWNEVLGQTMHDVKLNASVHNSIEPVTKAVYDLQDLRLREKKLKEDLNKLYAMWQNRSAAPSIPISTSALNTSKQHSRLIHFCHTPLLFLPSWRLQSAATRDHSLSTQSSMHVNTNVHQQLSQQLQASQIQETDIMKWHQELCSLMLTEYKQYLQIMGFNPVQVESLNKSYEGLTQQQSYYLKKSMLGGIVLFEIYLSQPFFIVKLHIIECSRLQTKASSALVNQFLLSFVDACDKIKINMHLHSFTYDFHLRCIQSYIAGSGPWSLQQGYHLIHFLDDFNKYYSKAPNYARNLIYSDIVATCNLTIPGRTLYSYLLSHEKIYNMHVFEMNCDHQDSQESEYVLVNLKNTPLISYCDAQDTRYTDDFDVALIVSYLEQPVQIEKTGISLKYYLMLTSKRELYPKREVENNKLGKFRTVYNIEKPVTSTSAESTSVADIFKKGLLKEFPTNFQENGQGLNNKTNDTRISSISATSRSTSAPTPPPVPNSPLMQNTNPPCISANSPSSHLIQIRQESINYLGYYSSHEQLMQQTIMSQAEAARMHILNMIDRGALQCKTHLLWNKLLESKSTMNYTEFSELCSLAHVEPLSNLDPRLRPLINQPLSWYQTLSKLLQYKYQDHHKQFITPDGNITHLLILHPSFFQVFMMLTIDVHASKGDLYAVYCKSKEVINNSPCCIEDIYSLIEGFVNACCFHLWMSLYN